MSYILPTIYKCRFNNQYRLSKKLSVLSFVPSRNGTSPNAYLTPPCDSLNKCWLVLYAATLNKFCDLKYFLSLFRSCAGNETLLPQKHYHNHRTINYLINSFIQPIKKPKQIILPILYLPNNLDLVRIRNVRYT
jgi:hypothetical protein